METDVLAARTEHVPRALQSFARSQPIVIPTETVYGLAAPIRDTKALERIYAIKGRPQDNPLIVHIANLNELELLAQTLPAYAPALFDAFWPGPLTVVLAAKEPLYGITSTQNTIAVRMPAHAFTQALINVTGPLAAPSANLSGRPSPTTAQHCLQDLSGAVELIFDGGDVSYGVESTVLDLTQNPPCILRPGVITQDMIEAVIKAPCQNATISEKSPGTRYAHYQPDARVILHEDPSQLDPSGLGRILCISHTPTTYATTHIALPHAPLEVAKHLYGWLRQADEQGYDTIVIQTIAKTGVGRAVMDRLERAAKDS